MTSKVQLACIAGGISVGVLCCFGGGAVRRERGGWGGGGGVQVNLKSRTKVGEQKTIRKIFSPFPCQ